MKRIFIKSCTAIIFLTLLINVNKTVFKDSNSTNKIIEAKQAVTIPHDYILSRKDILSAQSVSYNDFDTVKWDGFFQAENDVADGVIPVSLLSDPIYTSMNLPSESLSDYAIKANRDNGHILGDSNNTDYNSIVAIGAIYQTSGTELPDLFKINLGKIKVFGFNNQTNTWEILQEDSKPSGVLIYTLPWDNSKTYKVPTKIYKDHITLTISGTQLAGNALHFWGTKVPFDNTNYSYYATAYTFWSENSLEPGLLTAVNAIDVKPLNKTEGANQLMSSRSINVTNEPRTIWSTTIPNNVYKAEWGKQLQELFNK